MKLPRGKIKLKSLTVCGAGRKIEILYETSEREDKTKILDCMWCRKENRDSYETSEREGRLKFLDCIFLLEGK